MCVWEMEWPSGGSLSKVLHFPAFNGRRFCCLGATLPTGPLQNAVVGI